MELVNAVADEIESPGCRSLRVSSDVADRASLETVLQATIQTFGKVDILVNAAGFSQRTPTLDFPEVDWDHLMDTNLTGTLPRVSGFRTSYDRAQLWPHHQHRFDGLIAGPL
jgi:NADP-dependent 3-hydroxy acid dehydrogenase YdfG